MIYPADLMAWYIAGQDPACADPLMVELAWSIAEARGEAAARNYERIIAAADGGVKKKTVIRPNGDEETTIEEVLAQSWAIEKLDELQQASHWEISPNQEQAAELHRLMAELKPTPLLPEHCGLNDQVPLEPAEDNSGPSATD